MTTTLAFPFAVILSLALFSCNSPERKTTALTNDLKNTQWIIGSGGIIIPNSEKEYILNERDTTFITNIQAIDFLDEENFISYDSWECGNDCFTKVYGKYAFIEKDRLEMKFDSISKSDFCETPTEIFRQTKKISFHLVREGSQLKLIRK
ncbi:hypothetical protein [Sphingobacterium tabacisoli]|uniref:Lipocalin-like domain-containing protein n=1 Tax=Sphingobacterium tabacisoli TaxID=2044855 RepID=A0ABW5L6A3_9SPHI|nr:hypothetical protein [Sphingobacterium tabacisoli]